MRPITFSFSPVTASVTGFLSNATGATWTLTTTATPDSLGHQVTITNDSATDHSAKTALLTGTDAQDRAQTETMALPAASPAATTSTKYFKTLTSIVPSATIGADTMDIGWAAPSVTKLYPVSRSHVTIGGIGMTATITGTINYTVQHTLSELTSSASAPQSALWFPHTFLVTKTASADGNYAFPINAIRFLTNSVTNGATVVFTIIQGRR